MNSIDICFMYLDCKECFFVVFPPVSKLEMGLKHVRGSNAFATDSTSRKRNEILLIFSFINPKQVYVYPERV